MTGLADWLLEQIAEDERQSGTETEFGLAFCDADEGLHYSAARVLAECDAKRRLVNREPFGGGPEGGDDCNGVLRILALPYAGRKGYAAALS